MLHMLLVVCVITCICDFFGLILRCICEHLDKLANRRRTVPQPMFTANGEMPNVFDLVKRFVWSKFNIYKALRMLVSTIGFLANVILPYFLLSKFTKKTNASYHRQTYSYMPFMILDFEQVPVPTDELAGTEFAASAKKVEDINVLTSFNRYIAFMVSKVAMKAVYSTVHAAYSPAGYLEQLNKRDNAAAGYNVAGA